MKRERERENQKELLCEINEKGGIIVLMAIIERSTGLKEEKNFQCLRENK